MKILGIDTATRQGSVAVADGEETLAEMMLGAGESHAACLVPAIDGLLRRLELARTDLEGIAVDIGPGSFTGIRIGLATARGLAAALSLPLKGVSSFDVIAHGIAAECKRLCLLVNAHSYGVYYAVYEMQKEAGCRMVAGPSVSRLEALPDRIDGAVRFAGPDLERFRPELEKLFGPRASFADGDFYPHASHVACLFESGYACGDSREKPLVPLYLLAGVRKKKI
jgi:tRNA threonylcarbamoyladenosine biosynthesis protein TsaB